MRMNGVGHLTRSSFESQGLCSRTHAPHPRCQLQLLHPRELCQVGHLHGMQQILGFAPKTPPNRHFQRENHRKRMEFRAAGCSKAQRSASSCTSTKLSIQRPQALLFRRSTSSRRGEAETSSRRTRRRAAATKPLLKPTGHGSLEIDLGPNPNLYI